MSDSSPLSFLNILAIPFVFILLLIYIKNVPPRGLFTLLYIIFSYNNRLTKS